MDHLTGDERKDRWYAHHISPNFVRVANYSGESDDTEKTKPIFCHDQGEIHQRSCDIPAFSSNNFVHEGEVEKEQLKAIEHLQQNGYVIFSEALHLNERDHALQLALNFMEAATAAERNQVASSAKCSGDDLNDISPRHVEGGIIPFYGSGQSSLAWYVRSKPIIKRIFSKIWHFLSLESHPNESKDVISSLDGVVIWQAPKRKPSVGKCGTNNSSEDIGWFHLDQNPVEKPLFSGLQGLVNLLQTTPQTGGNVLIKATHKLFPSHYTQQNQIDTETSLFYKKRLEELKGDDWLEIDPNDKIVLNPQNVISCLLRPGDLLIWDSRLVHCSHPPAQKGDSSISILPSHLNVPSDLARVAVLVSMMPKVGIPSEVLQSRQIAVDNAQTLTHWANKAAVLGAERSREILKEKTAVRFIKENFPGVLLSSSDLTKEQRQLIG